MPTPPMRGKGLVCKCLSETGGTNKPRETAVVCTQNVMTMDMAKETIKLHTKRITASPSPCFPGRRFSEGKLSIRDLQAHLSYSSSRITHAVRCDLVIRAGRWKGT